MCSSSCFSLNPKLLLKKESLLKQTNKKGFLCTVSSEPGQIMMSHMCGCFQELSDRSNCNISPGMGLFEDLKPNLPPPVASRLQIFTITGIIRLLFFKATVEAMRQGLE